MDSDEGGSNNYRFWPGAEIGRAAINLQRWDEGMLFYPEPAWPDMGRFFRIVTLARTKARKYTVNKSKIMVRPKGLSSKIVIPMINCSSPYAMDIFQCAIPFSFAKS